MNGQELKTLIDSGDYHPRPEKVAQAMLRRRAVRELLVGCSFGSGAKGKLGGPLTSAGRIPSPPESPRQAA